MAQRVLQYTATIPANTPIATPVTVGFNLDNWTIESIDLEVPPGPNGLMGFQVVNNGVPWIPNSTGEYIVWNNARDSWYFTDQPNASGWGVQGYNLDVAYPHAVTVRFHVNAIVVPTAAAAAPTVTFVTTPATETAA